MKLLTLLFGDNRLAEVEFRPTIPLDRGLLCLDCESIYEAEGEQKCPSCGSPEAWVLAKGLNRPTTRSTECEQ